MKRIWLAALSAPLLFTAPAQAQPDPFAEPLGATAPVARAGKVVTLQRNFQPNPRVIRGQGAAVPRVDLKRFGVSTCQGYVSGTPDLVLNLPQGLNKTRVTFNFRGGGLMYVQLPNRSYLCKHSRDGLTYANWPRGQVNIYFGYTKSWNQRRVVSWTARFEDLSRRGSGAGVGQGQVVTLGAGFSPNPKTIRGLSGHLSMSLKRQFGTKGSCYGWVANQPDVVLNVPRAWTGLQLRYGGGAKVVHIRLPNNRYYCYRPLHQGKAVNLPAGRVELRFGRQYASNKAPVKFWVSFEDPTRPRAMGFVAQKTLTLKSLELLQPFLHESRARAGNLRAIGRSSYSCGGKTFAEKADFMIRVTRPIPRMGYKLTSASALQMNLVGPIPANGRKIPGSCYSGGLGRFSRLEPGLYAVKIAPRGQRYGRGAPVAGGQPYSLLLYTDKTPLTPLTPAATIPATLTIAQRHVSFHFPQFTSKHYRDTAVLQGLFSVAPKQLFVFPGFDWDKTAAKPARWQRKGVAYPKKNEPMLLIGRSRVVAADGAIFNVTKMTYLVSSPDGAVTLPRRARNPQMDLRSARRIATVTGVDLRLIGRYTKAQERYKKCSARVWKPYNRRIDRLNNRRVTYRSRSGRVIGSATIRNPRISRLEDAAERAVSRSCNPRGLENQRKRLHKQLVNNRSKRRLARLRKLSPRLRQLFR